MKLKQLKSALAKFPPDMDDMEMMLMVSREDRREFEFLCFVGYISFEDKSFIDKNCIALGGLSEIKRLVESGEISPPKDYDIWKNNTVIRPSSESESTDGINL
jgi:hypothetical protein